VMPIFGHLFDVHRYGVAFQVAAAIPVVGFTGWSLLGHKKIKAS
jgi:hypothetical protein